MSVAGTLWRRRTSLLQKLRAAGLSNTVLLLQTFLLLLAAKIALACIPVHRLIAWKQRPVRHCLADPNPLEIERVRWAVLTATRYSPVDFVCFPQCLAASELLRARGISTHLHYGAARPEGKLVTHTWLEAAGGIIIGGEVAAGFARLETF